MSDAAPAADASAAAPAPRRSRWRWRVLWGSLAGAALLIALAIAASWWTLRTPSGSAWLLGQVPGLKVTAPQGSLAGDFAAERVEIALPGAGASDRVVISGLRWQGLSIARALTGTALLRLTVDSVQADRVDVIIAPDPSPLVPPASLQLPLEIELRAVAIGELRATALGERPLRDLRARLHLGADGGRTHRVDALALAWDQLAANGAARIASASPFDVEATLAIEPRPAEGQTAALPFEASLDVRGALAKLDARATLRGRVPAGKHAASAPSLDLTASVQPFAAWPLAALQARTRSLDLSALHSGAPGTALSGTAEVASTGLDTAATVAIALTNARAGRIDEGLLPVRSLDADVRGRIDDPRQIEIHALDLALGTAREAGGRVRGSGHWTPEHATLKAVLTGIAPRVLDARAPAMSFSGNADLQADDWFGDVRADARPSLALRGRIDGTLPHGARQESVQLELDASATEQRVDLRTAQARAGATRASLAGQALRRGSGEWQLTGQGTLADFDPALWWPGIDGSAWRKGPHRLSGSLALDLLLPAHATAPLSLARVAAAQGQATLRVADSMLAGAPLAGEIALRGDGGAGLGVNAALTVAGTRLALRGRLDATARDHWDIEAHSANLAPLSPLLALVTPAGSAAPALAGALDADTVLDGRWPQLSSRGHVTLKDARASSLSLAQAALRWTASTAAQAPLDVKGEVAQLALGGRRIDTLRLAIDGSAAEHRIALSAASPVRPPAWIDALHGADVSARTAQEASGTLAELRAQGALQFDAAWREPLRWRGRLEHAEARRRGSSLTAPWFRTGAIDIEAQFDPLTATPRVNVAPGRAELPNLALQWSQARWQGGTAPQLDLQATIEPFSVAPLLARLQPEFGWGGDLVVAGRVRVHSAPSFVAEVEIGRQRGDLQVTDESGTRPLELSDLRLALDAHDGVWHFTQALAGKTLGAMAAAASVRTDAKALWPPANAPLQGVLELRIADLGAWGAWVPAGWRLKGALHASAAFGGQFGAPEYSGQIEGSGLGVRNLVEGVDVHDGELAIALQGETARIERLHARAGDGSVQVSGEAVFGASPQARLQLVAERLLVLGRVDRRVVASGDATLQLKPRGLQLDGRIRVDEGLIDISHGTAPTLADDVTVLRSPAPAAEAPAAPAPAALRDVKVNLALNLGNSLRLRGRGLNTRLEGDLAITAPDGRRAINGSVNAVQGTYAAYGQKLDIERGAIVFSGPANNPRLDILALRPNLDIRVGVAVTGTVNAPRIGLFSDPDLPDREKLSWLVLGRAPEGLDGSDTALLQAAAMALLAGESDRPTSELTRIIQPDMLSVRQTEGEVRNTVVSVGKQLSKRWYIGYERSLAATAGNWQLIYRVAQRFTVRLQTGLDNSIDLIWSWRWE